MAKYPNFLKPQDEVRIISPSGSIDPIFVEGAKKQLEEWGYKPTEGMFTRQQYGRFAGNEQERYTDLQQALDDPNVKAILCSRGGYGLAQIIDRADFTLFTKNPKWIIGFSDITILHQAIQKKTNYISIHSAMAKQLTELDSNTPALHTLHEMLKGNMPTYSVEAHENNRNGTAKGKLVGGNLSVFINMRATPFDFDYTGNILFIEDTGEKPYQIDRMMQNLRLSGVLANISGLIVGQFAETQEDESMHQTIYQIIANTVKEYNYPICFGLSAGHIEDNIPLLIGANTTLTVNDQKANISFQSTFWKKAKSLIKKQPK